MSVGFTFLLNPQKQHRFNHQIAQILKKEVENPIVHVNTNEKTERQSHFVKILEYFLLIRFVSTFRIKN